MTEINIVHLLALVVLGPIAYVIIFAECAYWLFRTPQEKSAFEELGDSIDVLKLEMGREFLPVIEKMVGEMARILERVK